MGTQLNMIFIIRENITVGTLTATYRDASACRPFLRPSLIDNEEHTRAVFFNVLLQK
jgi:hypothetical protein